MLPTYPIFLLIVNSSICFVFDDLEEALSKAKDLNTTCDLYLIHVFQGDLCHPVLIWSA